MLKFTKSYLQERMQRVVVAGAVSNKLPVKSGMPHGLMMDPLRFVSRKAQILHYVWMTQKYGSK